MEFALSNAMKLLERVNLVEKANVYPKQLSGGHSDDTAFTVSPEYGWGWLVDKGYDILQTDWPLQLRLFLNGR